MTLHWQSTHSAGHNARDFEIPLCHIPALRSFFHSFRKLRYLIYWQKIIDVLKQIQSNIYINSYFGLYIRNWNIIYMMHFLGYCQPILMDRIFRQFCFQCIFRTFYLQPSWISLEDIFLSWGSDFWIANSFTWVRGWFTCLYSEEPKHLETEGAVKQGVLPPIYYKRFLSQALICLASFFCLLISDF